MPAALPGGKVDVATIHGTMAMTVPAGTSSDKTMRLGGQGVKSKKKIGDHLVRIAIDIPKKSYSEDEQQILRRMLE